MSVAAPVVSSIIQRVLAWATRNRRRALLFVSTLVLLAFVPGAQGQDLSYHAGTTRISVPADPAFDMLVWYPTQAPEVPWLEGPFQVPASRDAPVAPGPFPIVLLSHGGGATGGNPLLLGQLSASLARQGFLVVAPFHGHTGLARRPLQVSRALDALLADPGFKGHGDPARLGMLGFSLGGAVTLELAGAVPNPAHLATYCRAHPEDVMSCRRAPGGSSENGPPSGQTPPAGKTSPPARLPLKAIVLLDPFAVLFQRAELTAVTMPVLIFRPQQSELPGWENAFGLAGALPRLPQYQSVPGGHFIFANMCGPALQLTAPEACQDPPGVDRAAVHLGIESQIAQFFHESL